MPRSPHKNPFYILVMIVGTMFVLSACAYGTVMVRQLHSATSPGAASQRAEDPVWVVWMHRHGTWLLLVELAVLAAGTVAAIGTDDYWERRGKNGSLHQSASSSQKEA